MATLTQSPTSTTETHRISIEAPAQAIWTALSTSDWTERYGYDGQVDVDATRSDGVARVILTYDVEAIADGHLVLSDLKALVETGTSFAS